MKPHTILVIDDDPDIRTILQDNLELDGYGVITADTGKAAIDRFSAGAVDLVILELMLPDMDGFRVCRAIRSQSSVSIILLTAKDTTSDKVLGLEAGADDYLVKPFDYAELAARIKARLRRSMPMPGQETPPAATGLRLDPGSLSVRVDGRRIPLTPKEFDLLDLLLRHPEQALERQWIQSQLWPESKLYAWSRTIDVHVQHLRAKLEENPAQPRYIRTVSGVGYMFSVDGPP